LDRLRSGQKVSNGQGDTTSQAILICDDDELVAQSYATVLQGAGWPDCTVCTDPGRVVELVNARSFSAILLDLYMPRISGRELLESLSHDHPEIPVIILTLEDRVDTVVECMKMGAFDFMTKPIDENRLVNSVSHAVNLRELRDEIQVLSTKRGRVRLKRPEVFSLISTASDSMMQVFAYVEAVAGSPKAVLITGESGTGKELVARAIHDASGRPGRFVAVNVAGLDDTVFSDTLFGHRKGAFTGADSARRGLIEQAAEGTLFLDEIGDLVNAAQIKLLRLLQEHEYYPLGSDEPGISSARILAATNADLQERVASGVIRKDLYYRLMTHHVEVPPLRDRPEDFPVLLDRFIAESCENARRPKLARPRGLEQHLVGHRFPGNVRQLQALVEDVVSRTQGESLVIADFLAHPALSGSGENAPVSRRFSYQGAFPTLPEVEEYLIQEALSLSGGNQTAAARMLGISQSTLSRRLAKQ
jgi:DNA-binding NtrC family response regulator